MKTNLFCFPFAGGSKYSYNPFLPFVPGHVAAIPVELPGRGGRFREALQTDLDCIVDDAFRQIGPHLHQPYALYGHSMGTVVAYLLARKIIRAGAPKPVHLFVTGRGGPSIVEKEPPKHLLPKAEFRDKLRTIGGSPDAVLADESMFNFFEPILRADFKALHAYRHQPAEPIDVPITVIIGAEEQVTYQDAQAWQRETTRPVVVKRMPGKHFFIFDYPEEIMKLVGAKLSVPAAPVAQGFG
jgi:surfactin synthase thioesterase subunit